LIFSWDNQRAVASSTMKALLITLLAGCTLLPATKKKDDFARIDPGPWSGPLAQKHAGKVVFSSSPIPHDGTDDSAMYTTYTLGEPLFIRMWSKDSPHNLRACAERSMGTGAAVGQTVVLKADVNNESAKKPLHEWEGFGYYQEGDPEERMSMTLSNQTDFAFTQRIDYAAGKEEMGRIVVRAWNTDNIPKLREGKNTIRVVVGLSCLTKKDVTPVAEGTLEVVVPPGGLAAYLDKYSPRAPTSPHPENPTISRDIIAAMKKLPDWSNEIFVGALVTSEDWQPVRNQETGVLVAYEIEALLYVRLKKEKDPNACRQFSMSYRRDAAGGDLYRAGTGDSYTFPCNVAPKVE
jgi:hypothetical protein